MELSKAQRNLISRGTLLCVAIALIYSGYTVGGKARELRAEWLQRQQTLRNNGMNSSYQRDSSGAVHLYLFSFLLWGAGGITFLLGVVPTEWLTHISVAPTTGEDRI